MEAYRAQARPAALAGWPHWDGPGACGQVGVTGVDVCRKATRSLHAPPRCEGVLAAGGVRLRRRVLSGAKGRAAEGPRIGGMGVCTVRWGLGEAPRTEERRADVQEIADWAG